jgi:hypothetical protein
VLSRPLQYAKSYGAVCEHAVTHWQHGIPFSSEMFELLKKSAIARVFPLFNRGNVTLTHTHKRRGGRAEWGKAKWGSSIAGAGRRSRK